MSQTIRVGIMSHRGGNIGHDLMALGVEEIVHKALQDRSHEIQHFEQHRAFEVYPPLFPLRLLHLMNLRGFWRIDFLVEPVRHYLNQPEVRTRLWKYASRAGQMNLCIAAGGPSIAPSSFESGFVGLMFIHLPGAFSSQGIPVLNLSNGSAFPLESIPDQLHTPGQHFMREMINVATVTTVRDRTAQAIIAGMGYEADLIPCPATATGYAFERWHPKGAPSDSDYIVINYQAKGANDDWGQGVDAEAWRRTLEALIERLSPRHRLVMVCHNADELRLAASVAPQLERVAPQTVQEYARLVSGAKVGLVSRIHAAIPLAGMGVPSVVVGTDTRLQAIDLLGLPTVFVKQAQAEALEASLEDLIQRRVAEGERLRHLRDDTCARYSALIQDSLSST